MIYFIAWLIFLGLQEEGIDRYWPCLPQYETLDKEKKLFASVKYLENILQSNAKRKAWEVLDNGVILELNMTIDKQGQMKLEGESKMELSAAYMISGILVDFNLVWLPVISGGELIEKSYPLFLKINQDGIVHLSLIKPELDTEQCFFTKPYKSLPRFSACDETGESELEKSNCANQALLKFMFENYSFPVSGVDCSGILVAKITIESNGQILNPQIVRDIGCGHGEAFLKMIEQMPRWIPAKDKNGHAMSMDLLLPFRICIE